MNSKFTLASIVVASGLIAGAASAATVTSLVGDTDNFGSGSTDLVGPGDISASSSDPAGFDTWYYQGQNWTHTYSLPAGEEIVSAVLSIRTYDVEDGGGHELGALHDGSRYDSKLYVYGTEIDGAFDTATSYVTDDRGETTLSTFNLDSSFFGQIASGSLDAYINPASGSAPDAIAVDFAELKITTTVVPLPASGLLLLGALGGFAGLRRKRG